MSVLRNFSSRAVKLGMVLTVVRQCEAIDEPCTAYRVARALDCSHVTARKYLKMLESVGDIIGHTEKMPHAERVLYRTLSPQMSEQDFSAYAQYLIMYHTGKLNA